MIPCRKARRILAYLGLGLVGFVAMVIPRGDRVILTQTEEAAVGFRFSLLGWELRNALSKWVDRSANLFRGVPARDGAELVRRYETLTSEIRELDGQLERAAARSGQGAPAAGDMTLLEVKIDGLRAERSSLRPNLEEFLESEISRTIDDERLGGPGPFVWPPVDFRMDRPPRILVTSPRDRILRLEDVLLDADIQVTDSERIEAQILDDQDQAALVQGLGGLATYPNIVPADYDLMPLLEVATHEWIHSYLFFHPLGQRFDANPEMQTLNETLASLAGQEIGWATWSRLTGQAPPQPDLMRGEEERDASGGFSFNSFMRETRRRVDELLGQGRVAEAEDYMESRRVELQAHDIFLRKLNQAYFAFHGTYADSPASTSPIGPQVAEYRMLSTSIGEALRELAGVGSYEEFLAKLETKRSAASR